MKKNPGACGRSHCAERSGRSGSLASSAKTKAGETETEQRERTGFGDGIKRRNATAGVGRIWRDAEDVVKDAAVIVVVHDGEIVRGSQQVRAKN